MAADTAQQPTLRYAIGSPVAPGDRLGTIKQVMPGMGTFVRGGHVYASVVGRLTVAAAEEGAAEDGKPKDEKKKKKSGSPQFVCSVDIQAAPKSSGGPVRLAASQVLRVGQIVLGRVERTTPQNAIVRILILEHVGSLHQTHEGAIRREDVKANVSADQPRLLEDAFGVGDIVAARIVSMGDARRYLLSTAEVELGVVRATSAASGKQMVIISATEMRCPETGAIEKRKCAKP